jgi:hypothetical protein
MHSDNFNIYIFLYKGCNFEGFFFIFVLFNAPSDLLKFFILFIKVKVPGNKNIKMDLFSRRQIDTVKFLKSNGALLIFLLYTISFINYYIFYKSFNISIFNYTGLNDLLFFSSEYLFTITALIFLAEIALFFLYTLLFTFYEKLVIVFLRKRFTNYHKYNDKNRQRIKNIFGKMFDRNLASFKLTLLFVALFSIPFLKDYKLLLFPVYFIYMVYLIEKIGVIKSQELMIVMSAAIMIFSLTLETLLKSYDKRSEKDSFCISFIENGNIITTDKGTYLNYLGETSTHFFLYDIKKKESKIYAKDNISDVKIKNILNIDSYVKEIKTALSAGDDNL